MYTTRRPLFSKSTKCCSALMMWHTNDTRAFFRDAGAASTLVQRPCYFESCSVRIDQNSGQGGKMVWQVQALIHSLCLWSHSVRWFAECKSGGTPLVVLAWLSVCSTNSTTPNLLHLSFTSMTLHTKFISPGLNCLPRMTPATAYNVNQSGELWDTQGRGFVHYFCLHCH